MTETKRVPLGPSGPEPLTVEEIRQHLRVDEDQDTAEYLGSLLRAAREWVENRTWLGLVEQSWTLYASGFDERGFELSPNPLRTVDLVQYYDPEGVLTTLPATDYRVDFVSEPARILPKNGWPETEPDNPAAVRVTYTTGTTAAQTPEQLRHAIRILCGHWYEHREEVVVGTIVSQVPLAAQSLCDTVAMRRFL